MKLPIAEPDLKQFLGSGPRYTSYPTQPVWTSAIGPELWKEELSLDSSPHRLAIYVHLPFCEKLCHFCACNRIIDPHHTLDSDYLDALKREIRQVSSLLSHKQVEQIHWGGGTPTFLSPAQCAGLMKNLQDSFQIEEDSEISIEVHPNVTTDEHLRRLKQVGFNRISMGVQDFDPVVQEVINRNQTYERTAHLIKVTRDLGFESLNLDLIYGLPKQTEKGFSETMDKVATLRPDRIALYGFANVPWRQPFQRKFKDADIPEGAKKLQLYFLAREFLESAGYRAIGMDHFALETDELYQSFVRGHLHRNFMGYTTRPDLSLIGFGVSAISDFGSLYVQNEKKLGDYYKKILRNELATSVGHRMTPEDRLRKKIILDLMCFREIAYKTVEEEFLIQFETYFADELRELQKFEKMGLLQIEGQKIRVKGAGHVFIRNICMVFDTYLIKNSEKPIFSKTI